MPPRVYEGGVTSAGGKDAYRIQPRTMERYRAGQVRNDNANLAHDLAARPAGKFQFHDQLINSR